jgi:hypothetical protein
VLEDPDTVASVIILTRPGLIFPDQTIQLEALALYDEGAVVVAAAFEWTSSVAGVAAVDAGTGLLTGGETVGSSDISVTVTGFGDVTDSIAVYNPGAAADATLRVHVRQTAGGEAIAGATVQVGENTLTTDAQGVAVLEDAQTPYDVHVFATGFNPVSVLGLSALDIVVPLDPASRNTDIGGFVGEFDFSQVTSEGDVDLGLAGASLAGNVIDLDLATLLGDGFMTDISSPFGDFSVPVPGGLVAIPNVSGVSGGKEAYNVQARGGLRFAWGLAGRVTLFEVIEQFGGGAGGGSTADLIAGVLPYFERFDHGLMPIDIEELPRIADADDIDGDDDTTESIADYAAFPELSLAPSVTQRLRTQVVLPAPNSSAETPGEITLLIGGTRVTTVGFVPLGINAATLEEGSFPDVLLKMAPPHSGLSVGDYAVLLVTFVGEDAGVGLGGIDLPSDLSGRLWMGDNIPAGLTFDGEFPAIPEDSSSDDETRSVTVADVDASLYRVRVLGASSTWTIFTGEAGEFSLPEPPGDLPDAFPMLTIIVEALSTEGASLDDLASPGGASLSELDSVVVVSGARSLRLRPSRSGGAAVRALATSASSRTTGSPVTQAGHANCGAVLSPTEPPRAAGPRSKTAVVIKGGAASNKASRRWPWTRRNTWAALRLPGSRR